MHHVPNSVLSSTQHGLVHADTTFPGALLRNAQLTHRATRPHTQCSSQATNVPHPPFNISLRTKPCPSCTSKRIVYPVQDVLLLLEHHVYRKTCTESNTLIVGMGNILQFSRCAWNFPPIHTFTHNTQAVYNNINTHL